MVEKSIMKDIPFFKGLEDGVLESLLPCFDAVRARGNRPVYLEGSPSSHIYIIIEGNVDICKYDHIREREHYLGTLGAGEIFGFGEVFFDEYYINAVAVSDASLARMSRGDFMGRFLAVPALNRYIMEGLANLARRNVIMLDWATTDQQMEYLLYYLCEKYGEENGGVITVRKELTHDAIARVLNISREYVTRTFQQFKKEGFLIQSARTLEIAPAWFHQKKKEGRFNISMHKYFNIDL